MPDFFPRHTGAWVAQEAESFRRLSMSLVEMAVITGLVFRFLRALVYSSASSDSWLYLALFLGLALVFLFGMVTLHLGNYTIKTWLWRAPLFAIVEAATESLASLALIAVHREPFGAARADLSMWPSLVRDTFFWRLAGIIGFTLLLAGVVQLARYILLKREHRTHTLHAVHTHSAEHGKP